MMQKCIAFLVTGSRKLSRCNKGRNFKETGKKNKAIVVFREETIPTSEMLRSCHPSSNTRSPHPT